MSSFHNTWLFSEDDFLRRSPSRKHMTLAQELKVRESMYDFLIKLATQLRIDGRTILAATIYINRFYMRMPITTSKYFVVCAAVTISCKLHDTFRPPDKIALAACQIKNPQKTIDQHSSTFWQWRDQLLYREELVLKTLNFEVAVDLPYDLMEDLLASGPAESGGNGFYERNQEILKNTVSKIEVLSCLPILVAYDVFTLFGAMLVLTVKEARSKFVELDFLDIPPHYLERNVGVSVDECFQCYEYIMRFRKICDDPKIPSHRPVFKKILKLLKEEFYQIANSQQTDSPEASQEPSDDGGTWGPGI